MLAIKTLKSKISWIVTCASACDYAVFLLNDQIIMNSKTSEFFCHWELYMNWKNKQPLLDGLTILYFNEIEYLTNTELIPLYVSAME